MRILGEGGVSSGKLQDMTTCAQNMSEHDFLADGREMDRHSWRKSRARLCLSGPFSITAVKRASRDCNDLHTLCDLVAGQISEPDSASVLRKLPRA